MESKINNIIQDKLIKLIDFVLEKNPNADRVKINRKIKELNLRTIPKTNQKLLNTITNQKTIFKVQKNHFSNYVLIVEEKNHKFTDLESNKFVIDIDSQNVIGVENFKGEVEPLTKPMVEICHKYKLKYLLPLNLNISDELDEDNVIVNEMHGLGLNHTGDSDSDDEDNN